MASYQKRVSRRLTRYSITLPPFEFQEDWTRQDKLTDWIEYACYTCFVMRVMEKQDPAENKLRVAQLGWIADQIPMIQVEMGREATAATEGVKRDRTGDDQADSGQPLTKKQKSLDSEEAAANCQPSETLSASQPPPNTAIPSGDPQPVPAALAPKSEP